ncbi:LOW QUALITY PROTEIN: pro-cathepsin H-like [Leguminivora glycinivorella]|uniref:LOW QUALITY PROTEIN: pro-cathepsin H-like n=1 Tax=Leguminivora glycinivorella TaxID=1035111 RepID=UPI00200EBE74|nr:LOW QUALITY PROTEIN: pro-cathepsin H-like [Leguminivora glycinivorella]
MILKALLLFCLVYVTVGNDVTLDYPLLKWPSTYSVEATKYHMSSGLIEDFKFWKTPTNSRLEANNGAVIKIAIGARKGKGKYEIYPMTTEEETNKMVCTKKKPISVRPEDFLPVIRDLKVKGTENVRGIDCVKFTNARETRTEVEKTLWAYPYSDNYTDYWVPVRYKTKEVDDWHGYLNNYEIWDYNNFEEEIDVGVFTVTYNCTSKKYGKTPRKSSGNYLLTLNAEEIEAFDDAFTTYVRQFGKQYATKDEYEIRKQNFYKSWRLVTSTNLKNLGYKLALNTLSDQIDEEISKYRRPKSEPKIENIPFPYSEEQIEQIATTVPKEYDLRVEGLVGPVLDALNEGCESEWAFAVTAAAEGALARSNGGTWIKLSEQALIDCSWGFGNKGCKGGNHTNSYSWIKKHGLPLQQHYGAYTNKNGFCKLENMTQTYKIKGYTEVTPNSINALKIALINHGPLTVNVKAGYGLMMYDGGILYDETCDMLDDDEDEEENIPMTLVGYGEKDGDTFWILKESNGPYWGIDGYLHISARDNNCGVMNEATYVVM